MNNENNTNQTNDQNVVPIINVVNDTNTIPVVNDTQQDENLQQAPQPQVTNNSTSAKSTPKVVKVEHIKEVVKEVKPKDDNSNKGKVKDQPNDGTPQKEVVVKEKGGFFGRFILFLFILLSLYVKCLPVFFNLFFLYNSSSLSCIITSSAIDNGDSPYSANSIP